MLNAGLTLTKACQMVQLDPKWLLQEEQQACKRINRIIQKNQIYSYSLHYTAKTMIFDWQNCEKIS